MNDSIPVVPFDAELVDPNEFRDNLLKLTQGSASNMLMVESDGIITNLWLGESGMDKKGVVVACRKDPYIYLESKEKTQIQVSMWSYLFCVRGRPPRWIPEPALRCLGMLAKI